MSLLSKRSETLLVVNKTEETLSFVDPASGREVARVPVGGVTAHEVAGSPDGRAAWVPIYGDSGVGMPGSDGRTVNAIDIASRKIIASVDLGEPSRPHAAVFGPKDGRLYVTSEVSNSIKIIDPTARKVVDYIPTGQRESHMMVITRDGSRAYTSNVGAGTVSAIDLALKKVIAIIRISRMAQRIAISTDDKLVFTSDQTRPEVAVIDTGTNTVVSRVSIDGVGFGLAPSRDGRYLLVAQPSAESVSVIEVKSLKVQRMIKVPPEPQEIFVRPDNKVAYVSCDESQEVAAIDLHRWEVERIIEVGHGADGLGWAVRG